MAAGYRVPLQSVDANKPAAAATKALRKDARRDRHQRAEAALDAKKKAAAEAQQRNVDAAKERILRQRSGKAPKQAQREAHDPASFGAPSPPKATAPPKAAAPRPKAAHWQQGAQPARRPASAPAGGGKRAAPPMPPTLAQRLHAALQKVHERLQRGDIVGARVDVAKGRALTAADARLAMAGLTEAKWDSLEEQVQTMPDAAIQVLKHAHCAHREARSTATSLTADVYSPFSALGVPKLREARTLNTVNKRELHKNYRRLALELHPDRCDHEYAIPAMAALNKAFEAVLPADPQPQGMEAKQKGRARRV